MLSRFRNTTVEFVVVLLLLGHKYGGVFTHTNILLAICVLYICFISEFEKKGLVAFFTASIFVLYSALKNFPNSLFFFETFFFLSNIILFLGIKKHCQFTLKKITTIALLYNSFCLLLALGFKFIPSLAVYYSFGEASYLDYNKYPLPSLFLPIYFVAFSLANHLRVGSKNKYLIILLTFVNVILSGGRRELALLLVLFVFSSRSKVFVKVGFVLTLFGVLYLILPSRTLLRYNDILHPLRSTSVITRLEDLAQMVEYLKSDSTTLFLGTGLGGKFYVTRFVLQKRGEEFFIESINDDTSKVISAPDATVAFILFKSGILGLFVCLFLLYKAFKNGYGLWVVVYCIFSLTTTKGFYDYTIFISFGMFANFIGKQRLDEAHVCKQISYSKANSYLLPLGRSWVA